LPNALICGQSYTFSAFLDGAPVTPSQWFISAGGSTYAEGYCSDIKFTPNAPVSYAISTWIKGKNSVYSKYCVNIPAISKVTTTNVDVIWDKTVVNSGDTLQAYIRAFSNGNQDAVYYTWSLQRNDTEIASGKTNSIIFNSAEPGIYRLTGSAICPNSTVLTFNSSVVVLGYTYDKCTLTFPKTNGTLVYLGSMYSSECADKAGTSDITPCRTSSTHHSLPLLPGTTHWSAELISRGTAGLPAEAIIRTKTGNWAIRGYPTGLSGENIGYDYALGGFPIPAPADLQLDYCVETWMPHSNSSVSWSFDFVVAIKCYKQIDSVYKYTRCPHSEYTGGSGQRARKFTTLFTCADIQPDAKSLRNRLGTDSEIIAYTTPRTTNIPLSWADAYGSPNPNILDSEMFFTDSNLYAIYEADGANDLNAYTVLGIEGIRPSYTSLMSFEHDQPIVVNRINRLYGDLVVYVAGGTVYSGSIITVTVHTSTGDQTYAVPVNSTVYANESGTMVAVGSITVDLNGSQFFDTGFSIDYSVNEDAVVQSEISSTVYPVACDKELYSKTYATALMFDGACYSNPVPVYILDDGLAGNVSVLIGCQDKLCGPQGVYCYAPVYGTDPSVQIIQPLGFPAPYIAKSDSPNTCYQLASFISEYKGDTDSDIGYVSSSPCGIPYAYRICQLSPRLLQPALDDLVIAYPPETTPHDHIAYQNQTYSLVGPATEQNVPYIALDTVTAIASCTDATVTDSNDAGTSWMYLDVETGLPVCVDFVHSETKQAIYGICAKKCASVSSVLPLPQVYDSVDYTLSSSTSISAIGLCSYAHTGSYAYYDSFPYTLTTLDFPNPDGVLTVVCNGLEYTLISSSGIGDINLKSIGIPYSGQQLSGTITFKFYTFRSSVGAHGELDVWFSNIDGNIPTTLYANRYRTLSTRLSTPPVDPRISNPVQRFNPKPGGPTRNGYSCYSSGYDKSPSVYIDANGKIVSAESTALNVQINGISYTKVGTDIGISSVVIDKSKVGT
jgi:hypothetical protein